MRYNTIVIAEGLLARRGMSIVKKGERYRGTERTVSVIYRVNLGPIQNKSCVSNEGGRTGRPCKVDRDFELSN